MVRQKQILRALRAHQDDRLCELRVHQGDRLAARRMTLTLLATLAIASPLAAQAAHDPTKAVAPGALPHGWNMKLDPQDAAKTAKFVALPDGFQVTSGGAAIYYNPKDAQKDDFTLMATFRQMAKNLGHGDQGEAFGLLIAGQNLDDAAKQTYYYFLVRQDGSFLINHRAGKDVHKIVDWKPGKAIVKFDDRKGATNDLAIKAGPDSLRFVVNNTVVHAISRKDIDDVAGQVGFRVNHNLDVRVTNYMVMKGGK